MKKENIKIGMKVVPFQKTKGIAFETSIEWSRAVKAGYPYLVVGRIEDDKCVLCAEGDVTGDAYGFNDFEPYVNHAYNKLLALQAELSAIVNDIEQLRDSKKFYFGDQITYNGKPSTFLFKSDTTIGLMANKTNEIMYVTIKDFDSQM